MGNTPKLGGPAVPRGDMGLGLCLACLSALKMAVASAKDGPVKFEGHIPQFAITMAPSIIPLPGPGGQIIGIGAIPAPTCWDHLNVSQGDSQRKPLLVAGSLP